MKKSPYRWNLKGISMWTKTYIKNFLTNMAKIGDDIYIALWTLLQFK